MEISYKVSELKKLISESSNEFKPKKGEGVEKENKKNNGKAYSDSEKRVKNYDGGLKNNPKPKTKYTKEDGNKTLLDYNPENAPESYKKRVHAQVKGYTSELEMNNGIEKTGDYDNNENIYQGIKKSGKEMHDKEEKFKRTGLQGSKAPASAFTKEEMYESKDGFNMRNLINTITENTKTNKPQFTEQKSVKTVFFKKTSFLTEGHMISRIPDEFKNEGCQFKMKDKHGTEYLIEWSNGNANIISCYHKQKIDETLNTFHKISNYNDNHYKTSTPQLRINEDNSEINRMLNIIRTITNEEKK